MPERAHRRLEDLFEISKLFASFENVQQTFAPLLDIVTRTLPLCSATLMEADGGRSKTHLWPAEGQDAESMRAVREHVEAAYVYLVGAASTESLDVSKPVLGNQTLRDLTAVPRPADVEGSTTRRFIVIPIVVAHRKPFGVLQLEGAQPFDKTDLTFVNAIANQLAIALDRDRAWQRDITRREHAEAGRTHAEAGRTHAEAGRAHAEEGRAHAEVGRAHAQEGRTDAETRGATSERERVIAEAGRTHAEAGRTDAETRGATSERERVIAEVLGEKYHVLAGENARLYEEARQAVRVREQILAIVSHDLKNPLGAILMTTDALAKKAVSVERQKGLPESIARIQRSAERMLRLIEDLLDFASIEAGRLAIKRRPHDPGSMIQETLASFESVAQEKGLRLSADVETDLPKVYCDGDRILQVMSNLVGNATKAAAEGGEVTLRVEARGPELLFAVSDNGPGISEEDVKHLFERYWRSGEAQYRGTGLGLAIARGIVSAHGGRIWAESELGRGATFFFTIPAADAADIRAGEATSHAYHSRP